MGDGASSAVPSISEAMMRPSFDRIKTQAYLTFYHIRTIVYQDNSRVGVVMLPRWFTIVVCNLDSTTARLDMARSLSSRAVEIFYFGNPRAQAR
jgi:hypothetical protein